jgi:hypothetical protein
MDNSKSVGIDCIDFPQDRGQWRALMNAVLNRRTLQSIANCLDRCRISQDRLSPTQLFIYHSPSLLCLFLLCIEYGDAVFLRNVG